MARDSGFDAEPVIGPAIGRTRWHRPGMTKRQTPPSGPCQSRPERVAKALFRDVPNMFSDACGLLSPGCAAKNAPVAQLDRALDYESRGQEFESLRARHLTYRNDLQIFIVRVLAVISRMLQIIQNGPCIRLRR